MIINESKKLNEYEVPGFTYNGVHYSWNEKSSSFEIDDDKKMDVYHPLYFHQTPTQDNVPKDVKWDKK